VAEAVAVARLCRSCRAEVPVTFLVCPSCHALVHAEALAKLATDAEAAAAANHTAHALGHWRNALQLLPPGTQQHSTVQARIEALQRSGGASTSLFGTAAPHAGSKSAAKWLAGFGALGLLIWKLKFVLVLVASKAKLLLLGLGKLPTLLSMLLSFGVYWTEWGWQFAAGFIVCMYVHEIGHISAARQLGIPVSSPMFVPGLGAFVRLQLHGVSPREDARLGLAGPIWGCAATLVAYAIGRGTGSALFVAIAHASAWLNLFNLMPVWSLDGGRGFNGMARNHRWIAAAGLGAAWLISGDALVLALTLIAAVQAWRLGSRPDPPADRVPMLQYIGVALALSGIFALSANASALISGVK
jgi:Zn-dependent protease